jgi:hypothetical protein
MGSYGAWGTAAVFLCVGLIAGLMGSGLDLSGFGTEEDIADAIKERLKG